MGVTPRSMGQAALQHEIDHASRSGDPFVLAFVDADGLNGMSDGDDPDANDALLRAVAAGLRSRLRSRDPIVRWGESEFVCGFTNTNLEAAARRVVDLQAVVEEEHLAGTVTVGLAQLDPSETLEDLAVRAATDRQGAKGSSSHH